MAAVQPKADSYEIFQAQPDQIVFRISYFGAIEVKDFQHHRQWQAEIHKLIVRTKRDPQKMRHCTLTITTDRIEVHYVEKWREEYPLRFPLHNIALTGVHDIYPKVNYIIVSGRSRKTNLPKYGAFLFLCKTIEKAEALALCINRAFNMAFSWWKYENEQLYEKSKRPHSEIIENPVVAQPSPSTAAPPVVQHQRQLSEPVKHRLTNEMYGYGSRELALHNINGQGLQRTPSHNSSGSSLDVQDQLMEELRVKLCQPNLGLRAVASGAVPNGPTSSEEDTQTSIAEKQEAFVNRIHTTQKPENLDTIVKRDRADRKYDTIRSYMKHGDINQEGKEFGDVNDLSHSEHSIEGKNSMVGSKAPTHDPGTKLSWRDIFNR